MTSPKTPWMTCSPMRRSRAQVRGGAAGSGSGGREGCVNSLGPRDHRERGPSGAMFFPASFLIIISQHVRA